MDVLWDRFVDELINGTLAGAREARELIEAEARHQDRERDYESRVGAMADALHEDCRLEWQAIRVVDPARMVTQHGPDAHYGKAHDLVRRLAAS